MRSLLAFVVLAGLALAPPMLHAYAKHPERSYELRPGQSADLGAGVQLVFDTVISDSRCPVDVRCVWAGEAKLNFILHRSGAEPTPFVLATLQVVEVEIARWRIKLVQLLPPRHSGDGAKPLDYRATISVIAGSH